MKKRKYIISIGLVLSLFALSIIPSYAATSAVISVEESGNHKVGDVFDTSITVSGGGESFNAAQAKVTVSNNLAVQNVSLGDCNFAYVITPSLTNPSFAGAILGGSSQSCTIYTLSLKAVASGKGTIILTDGSVKARKDSGEILKETVNGSFDITQSSIPEATVTLAPTSTSGKNDLSTYTMQLRITDTNGNVIPHATVTVDQSITVQADEKGMAVIPEISNGVHSITAKNGSKEIGQSIINVNGNEKVITLGIQEQKNTKAMRIWWILGGLLMLIILGAVVMMSRKNQNKSQEISN